MDLKQLILEQAEEEGLDIIRFTSPEPFDYAWDSPRKDPHITLPSVKTVIICGIYIGGIDMPDRNDPDIGYFSRLIVSGFYFDLVEPLENIVFLIRENGHDAVSCDGFSERSILPLKLAAVRAGVGWQGKNTLLITKEYGSFLALGGILTSAPLALDGAVPQKDHCGSCEACRKACPMNALDEPYKLNIDRCLSFLLEGESLSDEAKSAAGNMVLECDLCQLACPWNKRIRKNSAQSNYDWQKYNQFGDRHEFFKLSNLIKLTEEEFEHYLGYRLVGTDYSVFRRNVLAAMEKGCS